VSILRGWAELECHRRNASRSEITPLGDILADNDVYQTKVMPCFQFVRFKNVCREGGGNVVSEIYKKPEPILFAIAYRPQFPLSCVC